MFKERVRKSKFVLPFFTNALLVAAICLGSCSRHGSNDSSTIVAPPLPIVIEQSRAKLCPPNADGKHLNHDIQFQSARNDDFTYTRLRDGINSACQGCHLAPAMTGGFTYIDSLHTQTLTMGGVTKDFLGLSEVAEKMATAIFSTDPNNQMPPASVRNGNPNAFLQLGAQLNAWIASGKPDGNFSSFAKTSDTGATLSQADPAADPDCVPDASLIGYDYPADRAFAAMTALPKNLIETDLTSLDAFVLAQKGTIAYNVEYPLWADNAEKGRWIHVPMKVVDGKTLLRQSLSFDPRTKTFSVPDNTRFYKTFYREVKNQDGNSRFRRIETRVIVTRTPMTEALFGTYKWDEQEQSAVLVDSPYRDGSGFKDQIFNFVDNESTGETRKYAIPGKQRCLECHMGSENRSFVLGFTPLQIHRRAAGEGGGDQTPTSADLSQVDRFLKYGFISGFEDAASLPFLEWLGDFAPRNQYELHAQAYMVGNCAHCHNQNGFAFAPDNGITLGLTAGSIFNFNTQIRSTEMPSHRIVHQAGDLSQSQLYHKMADPPDQQGMLSQMPLHTPGSPNCAALRTVGKWIRSFESLDAAQSWEPDCKSADDFPWIDQDFTWPKSDKFTPRRADWDDPVNGMPARFRTLVMSDAVNDAISKTYPVGYWNTKVSCQFPKIDLAPEQQRPWMLRDGQPKRPFGEVYSTTPGSWYFRTTCVKCHGSNADGNSALAKGILNWSGGSVRVADLRDGLFGSSGVNLKLFDRDGQNLAGNYLIWMAMEGTRVKFPSELSPFVGTHGGRMLNLVREKCRNQISTDKTSSPIFMDHEIFRAICFADNRAPGDPALAYNPNTNLPLNPQAVEDWLDRGSFNAGWAIYKYLSNGSQGKWQPGNDECEKVYPKPAVASTP